MQLLCRIQFHHTYLALPLHSIWGDPCNHLWWGCFERHTHRPPPWAHGLLLVGNDMRGPVWQLVASPHGPHHWQPMCDPWECPSLAIHGAHRILLSGAPCGTNMDISRGKTWAPHSSPYGPSSDSPGVAHESAWHWPLKGPIGFCYLENLSQRWK